MDQHVNQRLPIHLNKLLNILGKTLDALEAFNDPSDKSQLIDFAARLNIFVNRADKIVERHKETLWKSLPSLSRDGTTLTGDRFVAVLTVVESERFNVAGFKIAKPTEYKQFSHPSVSKRTSFKPRS